jgi:hypothetical protein
VSSLEKHIDLSRFVALGDSLTAGYKDGALFYEGQINSFPNLMAGEFGCKFRQPLVDPNSVGIGFFENSRLVLKEKAGSAGMQLSYLAAHGDRTTLLENCYAAQGPFNNLGVPGAKVTTLIAKGYGDQRSGEGNYNPFFSRMCSNSETASVLNDAMLLNPTFFSLFIGNNDVMAYALSGGTSNSITPLKGVAGIGFEESLRFIVNTLISKGAKGAIANLPAITSIPFFNCIHYNDLVLDSASAESLNPRYHAAGLKFVPGRNPFPVEDPLCVGGLRQMVEGEFISLDIMLDEHRSDHLTGLTPVPKKYYLSKKQVAEIQGTMMSYNAIIKEIATENDLAFVDTNLLLQNKKMDRTYNAVNREITYTTGGFFSLDGLHINSLGHALLGNEFIMAINQTYGMNIAKINLTRSRERYKD